MLSNIVKRIKKKFENIKFKKSNLNYKRKLYIRNDDSKKYFSKRKDSFKIFKKKLEFNNVFNPIKNLNIYYYTIGIFLFLSVIYVVFFSHYFTLKNIDVIRNDEYVNIDMVYNSIDDFRYLSLLSIDKELLKSRILSYQPQLENIIIKKVLPDSLKIEISSFKIPYETSVGGKEYFISENGVFLPKNNKDKKIKISVLGIDQDSILQYKEILNQNELSKISFILDKIKEKNSFIKEKDIIYYKIQKELHIVLESKEILIFDLYSDDSLVQVQKFNIFFEKYNKKIKEGIYYIDLRIKDKIFFCPKKEEKQCKKNLDFIYGKK